MAASALQVTPRSREMAPEIVGAKFRGFWWLQAREIVSLSPAGV